MKFLTRQRLSYGMAGFKDSSGAWFRHGASACVRKVSQEWLGGRESSCEVFSFWLLGYFQRAQRVKKDWGESLTKPPPPPASGRSHGSLVLGRSPLSRPPTVQFSDYLFFFANQWLINTCSDLWSLGCSAPVNTQLRKQFTVSGFDLSVMVWVTFQESKETF